MNNNPGNTGKPAPWDKRADVARIKAFEEDLIADHPAYAKHKVDRIAAFDGFLPSSENPTWRYGTQDAMEAIKKLKAWDKSIPILCH